VLFAWDDLHTTSIWSSSGPKPQLLAALKGADLPQFSPNGGHPGQAALLTRCTPARPEADPRAGLSRRDCRDVPETRSAPRRRFSSELECVENGPHISFSPDGRFIAVHDGRVAESTLWLLDPRTGRQIARRPASWFRFSAGGTRLWTKQWSSPTGDERRTAEIRLWSISSAPPGLRCLAAVTEQNPSVALSPDERLLVTRDEDGVRLLSSADGRQAT